MLTLQNFVSIMHHVIQITPVIYNGTSKSKQRIKIMIIKHAQAHVYVTLNVWCKSFCSNLNSIWICTKLILLNFCINYHPLPGFEPKIVHHMRTKPMRSQVSNPEMIFFLSFLQSFFFLFYSFLVNSIGVFF